MSATYRVEILQSERPAWRNALEAALIDELVDLGVHHSLELELVDGHVTPSATPVVAVALLGPNSATDAGLDEQVAAAVADGVVVIPVVDDLAGFSAQAPPSAVAYNGRAWSGAQPQVTLARLVLEELDIEDAERRVFLSHRRTDGQGAAERLHDALAQVRFKPFIDRFAVPPGADVQREIADALEDFAFLLLLETPQAHTSRWVFDEVAYALSHTMGILIVQWPGDPIPMPGTVGLPRLKLLSTEIELDAHGFEVLTGAATERVLAEVEAAHAQGLVRRRRMLLLSAQEAAEEAGAVCVPLTNWRLKVLSSTGISIVAVAPRLPRSGDLQRLDEARTTVDPHAEGVLLHAARRLTDERRQHLNWVIAGRRLVMVPDNSIGAYW